MAKLGDYDGRLLLVGERGDVVDLPGPAHHLAYGRFLLVEHHSDEYAVVVFDVTAGEQVFSANTAVLANLLGSEPGDPPRWIMKKSTLYQRVGVSTRSLRPIMEFMVTDSRARRSAGERGTSAPRPAGGAQRAARTLASEVGL